eukprot:TRINITY_DN8611_c0_g2_i1.p1 TRINITY_DN8611_c0_g2~~TRINITY_DN8611_c0_g2_i1.p1  ORF type:complete len:303 (+),score=59.82 TRINITY_DN8611_c0_g2_i1:107-1015(+)
MGLCTEPAGTVASVRPVLAACVGHCRPMSCLLMALLTDALVGRTLCTRIDDDHNDDVKTIPQDDPYDWGDLPAVIGVDLDLDGVAEHQLFQDPSMDLDDEDFLNVVSARAHPQAAEQTRSNVKPTTIPVSPLHKDSSNGEFEKFLHLPTTGSPLVALLQSSPSDLPKRSAEYAHSQAKSKARAIVMPEDAIEAIVQANFADQSTQQAVVGSERRFHAMRAERGHMASRTGAKTAKVVAAASEDALKLAAVAEEMSADVIEAIEAAERTRSLHQAPQEVSVLESNADIMVADEVLASPTPSSE